MPSDVEGDVRKCEELAIEELPKKRARGRLRKSPAESRVMFVLAEGLCDFGEHRCGRCVADIDITGSVVAFQALLADIQLLKLN